ncbi:mannose-ethanolamine phosphotransferase gpi13 [Neonectria punicea]|uniref:Mannose-ethanolamine phosphotransferase gpi13 n=1 Tax=Neonectria punicea TaxID=979145 RepID=A0ABR1GLP6_9HYPO
MPSRSSKPKAKAQAPPSEYQAIAEQWAKAKRIQDAQKAAAAKAVPARQGLPPAIENVDMLEMHREKLDKKRQTVYQKRWRWTVFFWCWLLVVHAVGIWLFTSGFLLTRLVLDEKSNCTEPPIENTKGLLNVEGGCWHPKSFDRAVVLLIDALRYDFTVPENPESAQHFHNAFPYLYETAVKSPKNAFLRPFIADPPTTTLQRLKGLTTGTLPTFMDAGSNFAGTAIEEDNLLMQMKDAGKRIAHLGDDTWMSLFPGYFEANISKAYDSFQVYDLHTVDNGVIDHIFPLLKPERKGEWDLLIGHCLGVDHAGHRYGPDHFAMGSKLKQMNEFVQNVVENLDDNTLLVVMGDHGMDSKGDHGGESDDEVEAALWMYTKKPFFGRTSPEFATPPANAKIRPVNQIDLVPTLALLLGIPIPYNNIGAPIEEAFAGTKGNDWRNLAAVSRVASAGIERYQASYGKARGVAQDSEEGSPAALWSEATLAKKDRDMYVAFTRFQEEALRVCKSLWTRFDIPRMVMGIVVFGLGVVILLMYSSRDEDDDFVVTNDAELDYAERKLELMGFRGDIQPQPDQIFHKDLLKGMWDPKLLFTLTVLIGVAVYRQQPMDGLAALVLILLMVGVGSSLHEAGKGLLNALPTSFWGWLAVVFTVSQSVGFASNSFTIWEDSILLFFITTFGVASAVASFRIESKVGRTMGVYHSIAFVVLGRLASYSKLCREEQMPYCTSTYYASASSSTSATWQLIIPVVIFVAFPAIIKSFLTPTRSWEGLAPTWIGVILRGGLFLAALYWVIDAADNGDWLAGSLPEGTLKTVGIYVAQMVLALAFVAGTTAFVWAPPCVSILSSASSSGRPTVTILGYANAIGARYLLLPLNILLGCLLLSKPMGAGSLAIMMWQILSLAEILDLNDLKTDPIGPVMLAILGSFYYFKTGHQATLASIQWDSAFIPLFTIRYPWTPIVVALNTFGGQILAATSVPLLAMWKTGPKQRGVLETVARSLGVFIAYFAVEALATMSWAGWLRRHLMLYRVFNPRFMLATVALLCLDLVAIFVTLTGVRTNALALSEVFGFAD